MKKLKFGLVAILFMFGCGPGPGKPADDHFDKIDWDKPIIFPDKNPCKERKPLVMFVAEASDAMNTPAFVGYGVNTMTKWQLTHQALTSSIQSKHKLIRAAQYIFPLKSYRKFDEEVTYKKVCQFVGKPNFWSRFWFSYSLEYDYDFGNTVCEFVPVKQKVFIQPCQLGPVDEKFGAPTGQLISKLNQIDPAGNSPIAGALQIAGEHLKSMDPEGLEKHIILITSGADTCSGKPLQVINELRAAGIYVNVVGFENTAYTKQLNELAVAGGMALEGEFKYTVMKTGKEVNYIIKEILARNNPEKCNNIDDDCDGKIDEDLVRECKKECGGGVQFCKKGKWGGCVDPVSITSNTIPDIAPEICDGIDNDCNGKTDELFPVGEACSKSNGSCVSVGKFICSPDHSGVICNATTPVSTPEICDNKDNDCDGKIDEELSLPCDNGCGTGFKSCSAGQWGSCQITKPNPELCNSKDDDCDGHVDEGFNVGEECIVGVGQCAKKGVYVCSGDGFTSECSVKVVTSGIDICNGLDDDCDGKVDEGPGLCPTGWTCYNGECIID